MRKRLRAYWGTRNHLSKNCWSADDREWGRSQLVEHVVARDAVVERRRVTRNLAAFDRVAHDLGQASHRRMMTVRSFVAVEICRLRFAVGTAHDDAIVAGDLDDGVGA